MLATLLADSMLFKIDHTSVVVSHLCSFFQWKLACRNQLVLVCLNCLNFFSHFHWLPSANLISQFTTLCNGMMCAANMLPEIALSMHCFCCIYITLLSISLYWWSLRLLWASGAIKTCYKIMISLVHTNVSFIGLCSEYIVAIWLRPLGNTAYWACLLPEVQVV